MCCATFSKILKTYFLGGAQKIKILDCALGSSKNVTFPRKFNSLDHGNLKKR